MLVRYIVLSAQLVWKDIFRLEHNEIRCAHARVSTRLFYAFSTFWESLLRLSASFLLTLLSSPVYLWVEEQAHPARIRCHQRRSPRSLSGSAQTVRRKEQKNV